MITGAGGGGGRQETYRLISQGLGEGGGGQETYHFDQSGGGGRGPECCQSNTRRLYLSLLTATL